MKSEKLSALWAVASLGNPLESTQIHRDIFRFYLVIEGENFDHKIATFGNLCAAQY